jgi:hypothetical protein
MFTAVEYLVQHHMELSSNRQVCDGCRTVEIAGMRLDPVSRHSNGYCYRQETYGCCLKSPRSLQPLTETGAHVDWAMEACRFLGRTDVCMRLKMSMRQWKSAVADDTKGTEASRSCSLKCEMVDYLPYAERWKQLYDISLGLSLAR